MVIIAVMDNNIAKIVKIAAFSGERLFFELEGGMFASASVEKDRGNIVLFPWEEIFQQYIYEEDIPEPTDEQIRNAEENYYRYGADARLMIVD